jgi:two-component system sensor histidine kinase QseC
MRSTACSHASPRCWNRSAASRPTLRTNCARRSPRFARRRRWRSAPRRARSAATPCWPRWRAATAQRASSTDLSRLARRVVAELAGSALDKQQSIELDAPEVCALQADDTLLGILLRNLVDNAIRYSPARSRIRIGVTQSATQTELQVEDSGPGLSDEQRGRLGERFFRVLGNDQPGSGLGWSIAQRIAAVQGATLSASRSDALGGLRVVARWPR